MIRKAPGYVKLLGQTRNGFDIPGMRDVRTASSLFMTKEESESLKLAMDFRALAPLLRRERNKFARQDAAVAKFRKNYFVARERLASTINRNQTLMKLRHELQQKRRRGEDPEGPSAEETKPPVSETGFNKIGLGY